MADFVLKQGDTLPRLRATLIDGSGSAISIHDLAAVTFRMRAQGGAIKVEADADVVDGLAGVVEYVWTTDDVDTPGLYFAEWLIQNEDGSRQTVPSDGHLTVVVNENLEVVP